MKDLKYYERLPEAMEQAIIEEELKGLLFNQQSFDADDFLESLYEISSRQVRHYSAIRADLKQKINRKIKECWDRDCEDNTETCIGVIINLGLQDAYEHFIRSKAIIENNTVLNELNDVEAEIGESVADVSYREINS